MNNSLPGDKTLVDKACGGDERAFADLINQHRSLVFGVIWAVLRDADDTEDATQETFIFAYRNLSQLDDVGKFSSWLYPIEHGQEYDVQIAARGASLTSYIDGKLVNQVTDFSYQSGPIALNVWESKTAFRDLRFRHLH